MHDAAWPDLDPSIGVDDDVDLNSLWEMFEFFEAGHHAMDIMNPLSSDTLDEVIDTVALMDGQRILDIASGHGEFLLRCSRRAEIAGQGVDLSPWVLNRAAARVKAESRTGQLAFTLGSGADTPPDPVWDVVSGFGMSWIWGGFEGTAMELARRAKPGGTMVFGDIYLRDADDPTDDIVELGRRLTLQQQRAALTAMGLIDVVEVRTTPEDWERYDSAVHEGIMSWTQEHPAQDYLERHQNWLDRRHVVDKVGWTVWIAKKERSG